MPGWAGSAAAPGGKPREFLRLLQGTRAERDAVHARPSPRRRLAILRFSVFGYPAGVGGAEADWLAELPLPYRRRALGPG